MGELRAKDGRQLVTKERSGTNLRIWPKTPEPEPVPEDTRKPNVPNNFRIVGSGTMAEDATKGYVDLAWDPPTPLNPPLPEGGSYRVRKNGVYHSQPTGTFKRVENITKKDANGGYVTTKFTVETYSEYGSISPLPRPEVSFTFTAPDLATVGQTLAQELIPSATSATAIGQPVNNYAPSARSAVTNAYSNGTSTNRPLLAVDGTFHYLTYDGGDRLVNGTDNALGQNVAGITAHALVRVPLDVAATATGARQVIHVETFTGTTRFTLHLIDGKVRCGGRRLDSDAFEQYAGTTDIRDGKWHHIAASRDDFNGSMKIYVDGVPEYNGPFIAATPGNTSNTMSGRQAVGGLGGGGEYWIGHQGPTIIYHGAQNDAEVSETRSLLMAMLPSTTTPPPDPEPEPDPDPEPPPDPGDGSLNTPPTLDAQGFPMAPAVIPSYMNEVQRTVIEAREFYPDDSEEWAHMTPCVRRNAFGFREFIPMSEGGWPTFWWVPPGSTFQSPDGRPVIRSNQIDPGKDNTNRALYDSVGRLGIFRVPPEEAYNFVDLKNGVTIANMFGVVVTGLMAGDHVWKGTTNHTWYRSQAAASDPASVPVHGNGNPPVGTWHYPPTDLPSSGNIHAEVIMVNSWNDGGQVTYPGKAFTALEGASVVGNYAMEGLDYNGGNSMPRMHRRFLLAAYRQNRVGCYMRPGPSAKSPGGDARQIFGGCYDYVEIGCTTAKTGYQSMFGQHHQAAETSGNAPDNPNRPMYFVARRADTHMEENKVKYGADSVGPAQFFTPFHPTESDTENAEDVAAGRPPRHGGTPGFAYNGMKMQIQDANVYRPGSNLTSLTASSDPADGIVIKNVPNYAPEYQVGRYYVPPEDALKYTIRKTIATEFNTGSGVPDDARPNRPKPTVVHEGNKTVAPGEVFKDRIVNGFLDLDMSQALTTGLVPEVENVTVVGPLALSTTSRPLVRTINIPANYVYGSPQAKVKFVTVQPRTPSSYFAAWGYRGLNIYRSKALHVVDGGAFFSTVAGNPDCNIYVEGSWVGRLARFAPDVAGNRAETHNDALFQGQGNAPNNARDILHIGCTADARHDLVVGQPPVISQTGGATTGHIQISAVMVSPSGGAQPQVSARLENCLLLGGVNTINAGNDNVNGVLEVIDCLFETQEISWDKRDPLKHIAVRSTMTHTITGNKTLDGLPVVRQNA